MSDVLDGIWRGAREVLGVVAPTLATALGGPLAGTAVRFVTEALGLAPDTAPSEVTAVLQRATPEQLAALKAQEQAFTKAMRELDIQEAKLAFDDVANARARDVALGGDVTQKALAVLAVLGALGTAYLVLTGKVQVQGEFAASVVMLLMAPMTQVFGYYYGSSAGSQMKTREMAKALPAQR